MKTIEKKYIEIIDTAVLALDGKGTITFLNKKGHDILGYADGELTGKNWIKNCIPHDIQKQVSDVNLALLNGEIEPNRYYENLIITKSGEERLIYWHNAILHDDKGKIIGSLSSGEDITERKKNELELIKAQQALEFSSNPMIIVDLHNVLEYINPAWLKMWGYNLQDEVLGTDIRNFVQGVSLEASGESFFQQMKIGKIAGDLIGKKKDGTQFYVHCTSNTIYNNHHKPIQSVASFLDITDKKKTEKLKMEFSKQLEEKVMLKTHELSKEINDRKKIENKLHSAQMRMENQIKQLNSLYGISQILSLPEVSINNLLQSTLHLIPPPLAFPHLVNVRIIYETTEYKSEIFKETKWKYTITKQINEKPLVIDVFYSQDKEFLPEEKTLLDEIGERIRIGILRLELDQEKTILAEMVKNSPDAIFAMNVDNIITSWNTGAERIYGYTSKDIIGKPLSAIISPKETEKVIEIGKLIKPGYQVSHVETIGLNKSGKHLDISVTVTPIKNSEGQVVGSFSIARDFTDRNEQQKLFQEQILKSSQFKSEFMASMSHELRTPLNSIIGFTDVILERISGEINEDQDKYLTNVKSSALHLLDLINDVLDIAKIESGKVELKLENVRLGQIIDQINTMIKPMYEKKKIKFSKPVITEGTVIQVDRIRFKEILFNLISNAVKYTQEGNVTFAFSEDNDYWIFDVIDTGIGIQKSNYNLIFQDFKRIQSAQVAVIEGTGLGLSLAKRLIEYHGGTISFTSEFGVGSTFTFTIPKISPDLHY